MLTISTFREDPFDPTFVRVGFYVAEWLSCRRISMRACENILTRVPLVVVWINRSLYRMYRSSSGDLSDCDRKQRIVAAAATWSWRETLRSVFLVIPSPLLRQFRTPSVHARYSRNIAETQTSRRGNFYAVPSRCFSHRDMKVWPTSIVPRKMPRDRN